MCEFLVDDFSLLNSKVPDASLRPLGVEAGYDRGYAEAVHRIVDSFLRDDAIVVEDGHAGRTMVLPIIVQGTHHASRSDMSAKLDLALRRPRVVTMIPCDDYGAPSQWRIQTAAKVPITDDAAEKVRGERAYKIVLGIEAFARSTETYTTTGSNALDPVVLFDGTISGDRTGWVAEGGTLVTDGATYVGVDSDGDTGTYDVLKKATLAWDPTSYRTVRVEAEVNPGTVGVGGVGGGPYPSVQILGLRGGTWYTVAIALVSREDLGGGRYAESVQIADGYSAAYDGLGVRGTGGDPADRDLKLGKVTMIAVNTTDQNTMELWFDIPGSAPAPGDITVPIPSGSGMVLYTAPNVPELADHNPLGGLGPAGTYHLVLDIQTYGTATHLVLTYPDGSERTIQVQDIAIWPNSGFVCIADDVEGPDGVTLTWHEGPGDPGTPGTMPNINKTLLFWMDDPLLGISADYTILNDAGGEFKYVAPTPARPIPQYLLDGSPAYALMQAAGRHYLDPRVNRVFVAWTGSGFYPPSDTDVTWEGRPAWGDLAVPRVRWPQR